MSAVALSFSSSFGNQGNDSRVSYILKNMVIYAVSTSYSAPTPTNPNPIKLECVVLRMYDRNVDPLSAFLMTVAIVTDAAKVST